MNITSLKVSKDAEYCQDRQNRIYLVFNDLEKFLSSQAKCGNEEVSILQSDGENECKRNTYSNYLNDLQRYTVF